MLKQLITTIALVGLIACHSSDPDASNEQGVGNGWQNLLTDRSTKEFQTVGSADWQWKDGYIEANDATDSFLLSHQSFRDFELHVEFWPSPDANSGVFFRCQNRNLIANETCYELNIFDQHSNTQNATGAIINLAPPRFVAQTGNRWNTFDITVHGSHIQVRLNGDVISELVDERFASGPVALQTNGGLIRFKNIRVKRL